MSEYGYRKIPRETLHELCGKEVCQREPESRNGPLAYTSWCVCNVAPSHGVLHPVSCIYVALGLYE